VRRSAVAAISEETPGKTLSRARGWCELSAGL
jgi:hypothetical protein